MPLKNTTPVTVEQQVISADEWLILNISINVQYSGAKIGVAIEKDADGHYLKREKFTIIYFRLLDGKVIGHNSAELNEVQMIELLTQNPTARDMFKKVAYDAIGVIGEAPATSIEA